MRIVNRLKGETAVYAAEELSRYLEMITGEKAEVVTDKNEDGIVLASFNDLNLPCDEIDETIDDIIDIDIKGYNGYIAGSNVRSVLLGVYKYLKSIGCRFIRPGADGEYIPKKDISNHSFKIRQKGFYPFRAECLEGCINYEVVRNTIYWLPKVGYNAFMIQGLVPYNFFDRWFSHNNSTVKKPEPIEYEEAAKYIEMIEKDIKKCGLQFHSIGHQYTFEPFGYHYLTSWRHEYKIDDDTKSYIALVNGKRDVMYNSINFTNLCYTNKAVKQKLAEFFVDYMKKKPYVDFLHIWLADNVNNQCECEDCMKMTLSDIYVSLLNEIDEALTKNNIDVKIVFILYTDTRWAPLKEHFKNNDRFIGMTAISRSGKIVYNTEKFDATLPEPKRNRYYRVPSFEANMEFVKEWRKVFLGKMMFFDYHLCTDHFYDPGFMQVSEILCHDIKMLRQLNIDGLMNCKSQRLYLPTSLPVYAAGEMLFNPDIDYKELVNEYFDGAFGADCSLAYEYLTELTNLFTPDLLRVDTTVEQGEGQEVVVKRSSAKWRNNPKAAENFNKIRLVVDEFLPIIMKNMSVGDPCRRRSWELLSYHAKMVLLFAEGLYEGAIGNKEQSDKMCEKLIDYVSEIEDEIVQEFDLGLFAIKLKIIFGAE